MSDQKSGFTDDAICPHLGCNHDPGSRYMFPNKLHICLRTKPNGGIDLDHQEKYCLTIQYKTCPLYEVATSDPLPANLRREETAPILKKKSNNPTTFLVIAVLAIGGTLGLLFLNRDMPGSQLAALPATSSMTPTSTAALKTATPSPTQTSTSLPTRTATSITIPTATQILSPTPGPALGTPFGNYVIHQVKPGESLAMIAIQYQTTVERIETANIFREGRGIWVDDILVIPIGGETGDEVQFQYVFIEEEALLEDLSKTYAVASEVLREYNLLGSLDWVPAGRWLIIPVAGP